MKLIMMELKVQKLGVASCGEFACRTGHESSRIHKHPGCSYIEARVVSIQAGLFHTICLYLCKNETDLEYKQLANGTW